MRVALTPGAEKSLARLNQPMKGRIKEALSKLALEPPQGDIKVLAGRDGCRLRVGDYRVLYKVVNQNIVVHAIAPRGQAYKGGR